MRYTVYSKPTGQIQRIIDCPPNLIALQAQKGEAYLEGAPAFAGAGYVDAGKFVPVGKAPSQYHVFDFAAKQWADNRTDQQKAADGLAEVRDARSQAYPSIGDQLDMLWHAMDDGVMPKVEPFYGSIKAVKDAHPKPE